MTAPRRALVCVARQACASRFARRALAFVLAFAIHVAQVHAQSPPPAPVAGQSVTVEVEDVAGGRAYLTPGESAGLQRGDTVELGKQRFQVTGTSATHAVIDLGGRSVKRGARGNVRVREHVTEGPKRLAAPRALDAFRAQWPAARLPASTKQVKPVPLGPVQAEGTTQLGLSLGGAAAIPFGSEGSAIGHGELRARVLSEPFSEVPLRVDADAATQLWVASDLGSRAGRDSQPILRVRALEIAYGADRGFFGALGRLRYASQTLGMLDGAKLQAPLYQGLTLRAFGGAVPNPINGKPSLDAARFGGELGWEDLTLALRPRVALSAHASYFDGAIDERKLNAVVDLYPGRSRVGGYAELSLFDGKNPWNAKAQELSAAGANASLRFGEVEVGGRLDMARPERSRWLASYLPAGFLCTVRTALPSAGPAVCHGNDARYLAQADVGLRKERFSVTLGGTASKTQNVDADQLGGFLSASFLRVIEQVHLDASLMGSTGSLVRTAALSVVGGSPFAHGLFDVSLHYRPALTRYTADTGMFLEHTVGASLLWLAARDLDISLTTDAITGRDVDVVLVQTLLSYRPRI